ncbi:TMEM175 family protein [Oenococcus oeni]
MNKGRVESFTDAIVAIILTIMVLEIKVPGGYQWSDLLDNLSAFIAYTISFFFILVAWYNHHYMFSLTRVISKKIFWANNIWLFVMSFYPVSTAWLGKYIDRLPPAFFYYFVFLFWTFAYQWLSYEIKSARENKEIKTKIEHMSIYQFTKNPIFYFSGFVIAILIFYFPPFVPITSVVELVSMLIFTNEDSDRLFS